MDNCGFESKANHEASAFATASRAGKGPAVAVGAFADRRCPAHGGFLLAGYEHRQGRIAESILATVLFIALAITWKRPESTRTIGLAAQGFALLGTLVGVFTSVIGVGPRTPADVVYHIAIVAVLISGVVFAVRALRHASHSRTR